MTSAKGIRQRWLGYEVQNSNIKIWAIGISIAFHLVLLAVFVVIKFSTPAVVEQVIPQASIMQISSMAKNEPITPKPRIKRIISSQGSASNWQIPLDEAPKQNFLAYDDNDVQYPQTAGGMMPASGGAGSSRSVAFFGNYTNKRKICFVVDCSGSMKGLFGRVRKQLEECISELEPDQFFAIIFFGGDRLIELDKTGMVRATPFRKQKALEFIKTITPGGRTDGLRALTRAMQMRDSLGNASGTIYFLTDAFELDPKGAKVFCQDVLKIRAKYAPQSSLHPIMFWPEYTDKQILRTLAENTSGQFTAIEK